MTKTTKILLITAPILIGGYLIYKQLRGSKTYQEAVIKNPPGTPESQDTNAFEQYKVTTLATPLNVRESASASSAKIGSLPKGSVVYARASQTNGWMEYSEDGQSVTGYVSADYLTAI